MIAAGGFVVLFGVVARHVARGPACDGGVREPSVAFLSVRSRATPGALGALVPLGALGVHELRYLAGYGSQADGQAAATGHGYLEVLSGPLVIAACAVLIGVVLRRAEAAAPRAVIWALLTTAVAAAHGGQELIEGAVRAGHAGALGPGLWAVIPAAALVAGVLMVALGFARKAVETCEPHTPQPLLWLVSACRVVLCGTVTPSVALVRNWSARGPPAWSA